MCVRSTELGLVLWIFYYAPSYTYNTAIKGSMTVACYVLPTATDMYGDLAYKVSSQSRFLLLNQIP